MKPIILKVDADGKLLISADEIQKMVEDAYQQGREDGRTNATITYSPPHFCNPIITCDDTIRYQGEV